MDGCGLACVIRALVVLALGLRLRLSRQVVWLLLWACPACLRCVLRVFRFPTVKSTPSSNSTFQRSFAIAQPAELCVRLWITRPKSNIFFSGNWIIIMKSLTYLFTIAIFSTVFIYPTATLAGGTDSCAAIPAHDLIT